MNMWEARRSIATIHHWLLVLNEIYASVATMLQVKAIHGTVNFPLSPHTRPAVLTGDLVLL